MSTQRPDTIESLAELTALHVTGQSTEDDDRGLSFWIEDGEAAVDLRHDFGDRLEAAEALDRLADALRAHAALIRRREFALYNGPLTGPPPPLPQT